MKTRFLNFLLPMLVAMLGSCNDEPMKSTEAQQWISANSSEMIDTDSRIRIEPSDTLRQLIKAETSLDNVFAFSPKVKGTAGLSEDGRFLDFIPKAGELKEGVEYECRLNLSALAQIDTLSDFAFRFHVAKREMKMGEISVRIDPNDVEKAVVTGILMFSHDVDEFSADSKLLSCSSKESKCTIVKTDDSKVLNFVVSDICCHPVHLSLDGKYRIIDRSEPTNTKKLFTLPPAMEHYYKKIHPEYVSLPPVKANQHQANLQDSPMKFLYPNEGSVIMVSRKIDRSKGAITCKVAHIDPSSELFWHCDGQYIATTSDIHVLTFGFEVVSTRFL